MGSLEPMSSTLLVTTTGRPEQPEDGHRRRRRRGRLARVCCADVGRSDTALRTAWSGPTRQSEVRDSGMLQASRCGMCKIIALTNRCSFLPEAGRVTVREDGFECDQHIPTGKRSFENSR